MTGTQPGDAESLWGWRQLPYGAGDTPSPEWVPQGRRVGWLDGESLYLEPEAAYAAAQRLGQQIGDPLAVTPGTLWKRLHGRNLLVSSDSARETLKTRVTIEGRRITVIHLRAATLIGLSRDEIPPDPTNLAARR